MATWTAQNKSSSTWTGQNKNNSTWTAANKSSSTWSSANKSSSSWSQEDSNGYISYLVTEELDYVLVGALEEDFLILRDNVSWTAQNKS